MAQSDEILECRVPGRFRLEVTDQTNPIAVGDYVSVSENEDGTGTIEEIHERENRITRQATHGKRGEHILVSNVDQGFVVQSIRKPKLREGFIDRFTVTCEAYGVKPKIIINKIDLAKERDWKLIEELQEVYEALDYALIPTSIHIEESIALLREQLKGKTSVFIGPSGTGKTSLLNAVDTELDLPVGEVSDYSQKGKHTTTFARLLPLPFGGYIVDTPGIREFGLVDFEPAELSLYFPEMLEVKDQCKFNNCTHSHEPKCAVVEAYEAGTISASRYHSYLQILESLEA